MMKALGTYMDEGYYIAKSGADDPTAEVFSRGSANRDAGCFDMQPALSANAQDKIEATSLTDEWIQVSEDEAKSIALATAEKYGYDQTFGGLSKADERVIETYTYAGAASSALRNGAESQNAAQLKNLMERTASPARTVYRGVQGSYASYLSELETGDTFTDKGFASCSGDKSVAEKFSGDSGVVITVSVPAGYGKSLQISSYSLKPEENEVLLNANTTFKVVRKSGNNIECEVVDKENSDSRSDGIMSLSELEVAFQTMNNKGYQETENTFDKSAKSVIINEEPLTCEAIKQALSPDEVDFLADEFDFDFNTASDEDLLDLYGLLRNDGGPGSGNHKHKGVPGQFGGSAPKGGYLAKGTVADLDKAKASGKIKMQMNSSKQSKHFKGSGKYNNAERKGEHVSTFSISEDEIDAFVRKKTGSGDIYVDTKTGRVKETVDCEKTIGSFATRTGKEYPTSRITIHHSKDGYHAVPASSGGKKG